MDPSFWLATVWHCHTLVLDSDSSTCSSKQSSVEARLDHCSNGRSTSQRLLLPHHFWWGWGGWCKHDTLKLCIDVQCSLGHCVGVGHDEWRTQAKIGFPTNRPLGYERVYLPLHEVADTPFHIQEDEMCSRQSVGLVSLIHHQPSNDALESWLDKMHCSSKPLRFWWRMRIGPCYVMTTSNRDVSRHSIRSLWW